MQIHEEVNKRGVYKCSIANCPNKYYYESSLKKHIQSEHSTEYTQMLRQE